MTGKEDSFTDTEAGLGAKQAHCSVRKSTFDTNSLFGYHYKHNAGKAHNDSRYRNKL
jgi:hypothetical protein